MTSSAVMVLKRICITFQSAVIEGQKREVAVSSEIKRFLLAY
jgi:hypothetical protein